MSETLADRFRRKLTIPENIRRIFDQCDHEAAFKPYWPEMLDFELPENKSEERREIEDYRAAFGEFTHD